MIYTAFAILLAAAIGPLQAQSEPPTVRRDGTRPNTKPAETRFSGAGSLALGPLLSEWIDEYDRLHPGTRMSYQELGSTAGLRMLTSGTNSFAAIDIPISEDQLPSASGRLLQLPVAVTAVVPVYNLPEVQEMRLSSSTLASIFLGRITKWNDPAIAKDNPGVELPRMDIKVKHYFLNGGVDTYVMADYLSKVSPDFKATLGKSSGNWPLTSISRYHS